MTSVLRNIARLKFHPQKNPWLLIRNVSCIANPSISDKISINSLYTVRRFQSTQNAPQTKPPKPQPENTPQQPITMQQKLKKAVAEYGSTVIVFHVSISLVSLGVCYLLVSSGLDVERFMAIVGLSSETVKKVATNAGTFALAYAVHKVFAPVRIMITLTATPFIVRYLRQIGFLKKSVK